MRVTAPPKSHPERKLKNLFINPHFQFKFIGLVSMVAVACIAILYASNFYFFWRFKQMGLDFGMSSDHVFFKFIAEQKLVMDEVFLLTSLAAFIATVIAGAIFSHRIAGPLSRLKKHMRNISTGGPIQELRFRKRDFFQDLPVEFNAMLKTLASSDKGDDDPNSPDSN